jgi:tetratricopeptide (TPR) repeat protein
VRARNFWIAVVIIGMAAAGFRLAHLAIVNDTAHWKFLQSWTSSDMHSNREWAEKIADGDWLDRSAYRPDLSWQDNIAPPEVWARWMGSTTYYQPPLYIYLLAFCIKLTGGLDAMRWFQAFLGAANVVLIAWLGRKLFSSGAGLIAGLLLVAYGPFIFYDGEILRGTVVITMHLLVLIALAHAALRHGASTDPNDDGAIGFLVRHRWWLYSGMAMGVAFLADSAILVFMPLAALWVFMAPARDRPDDPPAPARVEGFPKPGARRVAVLVAGVLIGIAPLLLRNLVVGAPLFSSTTRAPLAFIMGNAPGALPVGAAIPESTASILQSTDYGTLATLRETLKAHEGSMGTLLDYQWQKLQGLFNSYEVPDNPSYYYLALKSPVLRWGLRFSCLSGLGLVGLFLAARKSRWFLLIHFYTAGVLSLFLLAHVVSRYRQPLVIPLALASGFALTAAWSAVKEKRLLAGILILFTGVGLSLAFPSDPPAGYRYYRPAEFLVAASQLESEGEISLAAKEIKQAIELGLSENVTSDVLVRLGLDLGKLYLRHERYPEALSAFRDVMEEDPRNAEALALVGGIHHDTNQPMQALKVLSLAAQEDPGNAEVHARLGHLYWFVFKDGEKALMGIRTSLELAPESPMARQLSALAAEISAAQSTNP